MAGNDDKDRLSESKEGPEPGDDVADDVADHAKVRTVSALGVVEHPENCFECWKDFQEEDHLRKTTARVPQMPRTIADMIWMAYADGADLE